MISKDKKALLFTFLKAGMGLTMSCEISGLQPDKVSTEIENNEDFRKECLNQLENGKKAIAIISNQYFNEKKFTQWLSHTNAIDKKIYELVLWESFSKRDAVNSKVIIEAISIYKTIPEAATSIGYKSPELRRKIATDPIIKRILETITT